MEAENVRNNSASLDSLEGENEGIPIKRKQSNGWSTSTDKKSKFETVMFVQSGKNSLDDVDGNVNQESSIEDCVDFTKAMEKRERNVLRELQESTYLDPTENNNSQDEYCLKERENIVNETNTKRNINKNEDSKEELTTDTSEIQPVYVKQSEKFLALIEKSNLAYEQQNILLEKQIEKVKQNIEKLEGVNQELDEEFKLFHIFSQQIENRVVQAFSKVPIPNEPHGANSVNICRYMTNLYALHTSSDSKLVEEVKKIIETININVDLRDFL